MGDAPDYRRLAAEVLGIRNAPPELARRLVAQALVVEERRERWQRVGERICAAAPPTPGVYILRDEQRARAVRRQGDQPAAPAARAFRAAALAGDEGPAGACGGRRVGGGRLGARSAAPRGRVIHELRRAVNVQIGPPALEHARDSAALVRDVIVVVPSVETDSVELVAARADGGWMIQRTRRNGADLAVACVTR